MVNNNSTADRPSASESFLRAIDQIARALRDVRKQGIDDSSIQAIEAIRKKQEEHEERKRRIAETIANGDRLSRNL
jgi:hypothetical protein